MNPEIEEPSSPPVPPEPIPPASDLPNPASNPPTSSSPIGSTSPKPLSQPESASMQKRQNTSQSIATLLLAKDSQSKSHKAKIRQIEKSKQLNSLQQAPKINPNSKKHLKSRSQADILSVLNSLPHANSSRKKPHRKHQVKIDNRRPQDYIPAPDHSTIKILTRQESASSPAKAEKVDLKSMNLIAKTKYFKNKKSEKEKEAEAKKMNKEKEVCTFKPNLKKEAKKGKAGTSWSEKISPQLSRSQSRKNEVKAEVIRIPPPNKHVKTNSVGSAEQTLFLSSHYSQFSPIIKNFGFKEGADIKQSQAMLTYNAYTNRK